MRVRLLVHRWFANGGAGWAYHPDLQPSLMACRVALRDDLHGDPGPVGAVEVPDAGFVLVGVRTPDPDRAKDDYGRSLVVLQAAALPGRPDEAAQEALRRLLRGVSVPGGPGADGGLTVDWSGPLTPLAAPKAPPPAPPPQRRGRLVWLAAAVAGGAVLVGAALTRLPPSGPAPSPSEPVTAPRARGDTAPAGRKGPDVAEREKQLTRLLSDIRRAGDAAAVKDLLQANDFGQFPPDRLAEISEALRNSCKQLLDNPRADTPTGEDEEEVNRSVDAAEAVRELIRLAPECLTGGMDVRPPGANAKTEKENWDLLEQRACTAINGLRYRRIRSCREALVKEISRNSKEWTKSFQTLRSSLNDYSRPRRQASPQVQAAVDRLGDWCNRITADTTYEFQVSRLPQDWYLLLDRDAESRLVRGDAVGAAHFKRKLLVYSFPRPTFPLNVDLCRSNERKPVLSLTWTMGSPSATIEPEKPPKIEIDCPFFELPACPPFEELDKQGAPPAVPPGDGRTRPTEPHDQPRAAAPGARKGVAP